MTTQLIQAVQRAIEMLTASSTFFSTRSALMTDECRAAAEELRTAIQQAETQQPVTTEPVWFHKHWGDGDDIFYRPDDRIPPGSTPLYAHSAPCVPEGYALVPIEPTAEMLQAALKVATPGALRAAWARMLAASPVQKGKA